MQDSNLRFFTENKVSYNIVRTLLGIVERDLGIPTKNNIYDD